MAYTDQLIAYYSLEEASGSRADASGNGFTLTDNNTVTQNTGIQGNCAQFTAANTEWLSRADNASFSTGDIDFTIAAWVYLDSVGAERCIASKYSNTASGEWLFRVDSSNRLSLFVVNQSTAANAQVNTTATLSVSTWYFCVGWHDSVNNLIKCTLNDGTVASNTWANTIQDSTEDFRIGTTGAGAGRLMNGRVDEVAFWKRLLTAGEITDLYNAGAGRNWAYVSGAASAPIFPPRIPPAILAR